MDAKPALPDEAINFLDAGCPRVLGLERAQRAVKPQSITANTIARNTGWYSLSKGQLIKTFVSYPTAGERLGIGLERFPLERRGDRSTDFGAGQHP